MSDGPVFYPVKRMKDALFAECRECGHWYGDDAPWGLRKSMGLHSHKNDDGTWSNHGERKFFYLYGLRSENTLSRMRGEAR